MVVGAGGLVPTASRPDPLECFFPMRGGVEPNRMSQHPDLVEEQAYIDFAYTCLERSREDAWRLRDLTEAGRGGTHQNRYERDVFDEALYSRLTQLDLHDSVLVFGRIDRLARRPATPSATRAAPRAWSRSTSVAWPWPTRSASRS